DLDRNRRERDLLLSGTLAPRILFDVIPIRLVASLHNTSVQMIERTYSKYITEHSDEISRRALLQDAVPIGENVVALPAR
ncbi:hypothetical protein ACQR1Q_08860, partial [Bradyrhizobium oligotrophicum]